MISWIGGGVKSILVDVDKDQQILVAVILILWVSALASSFIDNIPFTTAMVKYKNTSFFSILNCQDMVFQILFERPWKLTKNYNCECTRVYIIMLSENTPVLQDHHIQQEINLTY